ncbi:MAG: class IV adenylate cyclase [Methanotrichaceae archaeon]|nr:class IV adenylate cyclase [Methanotrichaceae archaeon]
MIEIEVKAKAGSDMLAKIKATGAVFLATETHRDVYFSSPLRDFKKTDEALRIRIKEAGAWLTYKGPKLDLKTKSRKEIAVKIEDPVAMEQLLISLGFLPYAEVKKKRTKYALDELVFSLDEVEGLGAFLEVETSGENDWMLRREKVLRILDHFGLESIRKSYLELLDEQT